MNILEVPDEDEQMWLLLLHPLLQGWRAAEHLTESGSAVSSWHNSEGESQQSCALRQNRKKETNCQEDNKSWKMDGEHCSVIYTPVLK